MEALGLNDVVFEYEVTSNRVDCFSAVCLLYTSSLIVGVATGSLAVGEMFSSVGEGVTGMYDITVISIVVACIVSLVKEFGGIQFILNLIKKSIKGQRGGEVGIAGLSLLVDMCTANNTVAIVMAGPIAKEISDEFEISPRRSASLLDIFRCV